MGWEASIVLLYKLLSLNIEVKECESGLTV